MYKLEVQEENGLWHDVRGSDGEILTFETESEARSKLEEMFPTLVKLEQFAAAPKRTRVIKIWTDEDDEDWKG